MSGKNKVDASASATAIDSSPAVPPSRAGSLAAPPPDTTDWPTKLRTYGEANALAGKRNRYDDATLIAGALRIGKIPTANRALAAALAQEALGPGYFAAMGGLSSQLAALIKKTPPKLSSWELLPPPQKAIIEKVGQQIRDARELVFELAVDTGREGDLKPLGRGLSVGKSPESIAIAGRKFVSGAKERMPLLLEARVTQATLDAINSGLDQLGTISVVKGERAQEKGDLSSELSLLQHAILVGFSFLRNRIKAAFQQDQAGRNTALRNIPRAPDRRASKPAAPPAAKRKKATLKEKAAAKRARKEERAASRRAAAEQKAAEKLAAKTATAGKPVANG